MIKDTTFYDRESSVYSEKRYPEKAKTYTQFFFKKRLEIAIGEIARSVGSRSNLSLLEIGCADGVVIFEVKKKLGRSFSRLLGIDIAPKMIEEARNKNRDASTRFEVRGKEIATVHDVVIEIGVINYASLDEEIRYVERSMGNDAIAIISLAGTGSLLDKTRKVEMGFRNFLSYGEYEERLDASFVRLKTIPVGLALPIIWRVPALARPFQALMEVLLRPIVPNAFHEKVYVLKKRG